MYSKSFVYNSSVHQNQVNHTDEAAQACGHSQRSKTVYVHMEWIGIMIEDIGREMLYSADPVTRTYAYNALVSNMQRSIVSTHMLMHMLIKHQNVHPNTLAPLLNGPPYIPPQKDI